MIPNREFSFDAYWNAVEDIARRASVPLQLHARVAAFIANDYRRACDVMRWTMRPGSAGRGSGLRTVEELLVGMAAEMMIADILGPPGMPYTASRRISGPMARGIGFTRDEYWDQVETVARASATMGRLRTTVSQDDREDWVRRVLWNHPMVSQFYYSLSVIEYSGNPNYGLEDLALVRSGTYGLVSDFLIGHRGGAQEVIKAIAAGAMVGDVLRRFRAPQWIPNPHPGFDLLRGLGSERG